MAHSDVQRHGRSCSSGSCRSSRGRATSHARRTAGRSSRQIANAHTTFNIVCASMAAVHRGYGEDRDVSRARQGRRGGARRARSSLTTDPRSAGVHHQDVRRAAKYCDKVRAMLAAAAEPSRTGDAAALAGAPNRLRAGGNRGKRACRYAVRELPLSAGTAASNGERGDIDTSCSSWTRRYHRLCCSKTAAHMYEASASRRRSSLLRTRGAREPGQRAAMVADMYDACAAVPERRAPPRGSARRASCMNRSSGGAGRAKSYFRRVGGRQCAPEQGRCNQLLLCLERAGNECSNLVNAGSQAVRNETTR